MTFAGLDFHVLLTLLFRGWGIVAGALTTLLLPAFLTPTQQGFYYTFGSVLALQVFFELGLNQVVVQLVSHEAAHLQIHDDGKVTGDPARTARLVALIRLLRRWYMLAAVIFAVAAGTAGWVFFSRQAHDLPLSQWIYTWASLVSITAFNLFLSPRLAVIEGTGHVGQVARLRLGQSLVGYALMWGLLFAGGGLWIAVAVPVVNAVATLAWLRARGATLADTGRPLDTEMPPISWRRDVLPLQWRIALSWICGFFIFNLFTPIVFANHGPAEAGRLGMAMAVFNAATTLGLSWINAKAPAFSMHIARGESASLNTLFRTVALRSTGFTAFVSLVIVAVVAAAVHFDVGPHRRIADSWSVFWLAWATTVNVLVYAGATYMRAHREEPMVPVSIVSAVLTIGAATLSGHMSLANLMALYAGIGTCVALPWTLILLRRYQRRHRTNEGASLTPPVRQ